MTTPSAPDRWALLPSTELVARAVIGPAPRMPLAALAASVDPVLDHTGDIVDWRLAATPLDDPGLLTTYRSWRATWRPEWAIGSVELVSALCDEMADIEHDLDRRLERALRRVVDGVADGGTGASIPGTAASAMRRELETVRLALSVDDRTGWAIVDDMPAATRSSGLARTFPPVGDDVVIAGTGTAAVLLRPIEGLALLHGVPAEPTLVTIDAVDLRHDEVVVLDRRGASHRLPLAACRPLGWVVPRSLRWHVRRVPLVVVWALLFEGLGAALDAAERAGGWVDIVPG